MPFIHGVFESLQELLHVLLVYVTAHSGVPRVSRVRGQSLFVRPHLARSWHHRCKE